MDMSKALKYFNNQVLKLFKYTKVPTFKTAPTTKFWA